MTTITPDFPDWTPGQVSAAASRLLYQSPAYEQLPVTRGLFDVRAYNSIDVVIDSHDTASLSPIAVTVMWQTQGLTTHVDFLTVGNGYTSDSGVCTSAFTIPCRGDFVTVRLIGGNPQKDVFVTVTTSSRQVGNIVAANSSGNEGQILAAVNNAALAAGQSITMFYGPVDGPVNIALSGSTKLQVRAITYYLVTGNWNVARLDGPTFGNPAGAVTTVACPYRICAAVVDNTDTIAQTVNAWVTAAS